MITQFMTSVNKARKITRNFGYYDPVFMDKHKSKPRYLSDSIEDDGLLRKDSKGRYVIHNRFDAWKVYSECMKGSTFPPCVIRCKDASFLFSDMRGVKKFDYIDSHGVNNMSYMFDGCSNLVEAPYLETKEVTDMSFMFNYCYSLKKTPNYNVSEVKDAYGMFNGCNSLINVLDPKYFTKMKDKSRVYEGHVLKDSEYRKYKKLLKKESRPSFKDMFKSMFK